MYFETEGVVITFIAGYFLCVHIFRYEVDWVSNGISNKKKTNPIKDVALLAK